MWFSEECRSLHQVKLKNKKVKLSDTGFLVNERWLQLVFFTVKIVTFHQIINEPQEDLLFILRWPDSASNSHQTSLVSADFTFPHLAFHCYKTSCDIEARGSRGRERLVFVLSLWGASHEQVIPGMLNKQTFPQMYINQSTMCNHAVCAYQWWTH